MPPAETSPNHAALPIAPSLAPTLEAAHLTPRGQAGVDGRVVFISLLAVLVALAAGVIASLLTQLIGLCTNLAFYGRVSTSFVSPAGHRLGGWVVLVPVVGGLLVGLMARYGSKAIRGHGIPEAMEQVLTNESRIPARMTFLKPLSAAISIGTGGPFGAEGPIIATGGARGEQRLAFARAGVHDLPEQRTERAAGMSATFGSPVSAVLLAIELLLFEYRARSLIPVALAAAVATAVHVVLVGAEPAFSMPELQPPAPSALLSYAALGLFVGLVSVAVTRAVYAVEDAFEKLPIHWMWWPALGGVVVGLVGYVAPRTLGVGYDNIEQTLAAVQVPSTIMLLCTLKLVSWAISLGSGTSGGTLAPLFTIGGGLGAALGALAQLWLPSLQVDPRLAALVGMAAMFAGASRALLASVVFAFETTRQPLGLLPLLAGCTGSFLVSSLLMQNSIMTEKIARRGVRALGDYSADFLDQLHLRDYTGRAVSTLRADDTARSLAPFFASRSVASRHQGYPVLDERGELLGVVTRKDLYDAPPDQALRELLTRPCLTLHEQHTLRDAANLMAREQIGRVPIVSSHPTPRLLGIVTRSDLVDAHAARLAGHERKRRSGRARNA